MKQLLVFAIISVSVWVALSSFYPTKNIQVSKPTKNNFEDVAKQPNKPENFNLSGGTKTQTYITKPSLQEIFNNQLVQTNDTVIIAATGDFIPARSVNALSVQKNDYTWTVEGTKQLFNNADIVLVNLETPLIENCPITNEGFKFCGNLKHIQAIKEINTSVINLANNHSHNFGQNGITQTTNLLDRHNIKYSGIYGENAVITSKGITFAFLGYNNIGYNPNPVKPANKDLIEQDIKKAKQSADFVVVSYSWGEEYTTNLTKQQIDLGHFAIDSGADLVIGNHPHIVQPLEIYKDKLIMYAHGNYVFDQMWSEDTKKGVIGYYQFNKKGLVQADFSPIYIQNYGQSIIPNKNAGAEIIENLQNISYSFAYSN